MLPGGILINKKTNTFHPILFRCSPQPSSNFNDPVQRFKSIGHHTNGFSTIEEAKAHIISKDVTYFEEPFYDSGMIWEWSGEDIPAIVCHFEVK